MTGGQAHVRFSPRLGLVYAAGDIGPSLTSLCLSFYWLYFLVNVAGLSPAVAGLVHGSGYAVSAVANLWAGHILDRHLGAATTRAGLIAIAGCLMAALFAALWLVPGGGGAVRLGWYLAASWSFHLLFSFVYLSYLSLTTLLGDAEHEQVDLSSYRFAATMTLSLIVLSGYSIAEPRMALAPRLLALGATGAALAIAGSLVCGLVLRRRFRCVAVRQGGAGISWRQLAGKGGLRAGFALNLAVWLTVQTALVLTAFLCAALGVRAGPVLLTLQGATILSAGTTSLVTRRLSMAPVMASAALCSCLGAGLWAMAWPFAAAILLGAGLGAGTVLSWAEVARHVGALGREGGQRVEARAYAALTALRDLVSAVVPAAIGIALSGTLFAARIDATSLLLLVAIGAAGIIALNLRTASRPGRA